MSDQIEAQNDEALDRELTGKSEWDEISSNTSVESTHEEKDSRAQREDNVQVEDIHDDEYIISATGANQVADDSKTARANDIAGSIVEKLVREVIDEVIMPAVDHVDDSSDSSDSDDSSKFAGATPPPEPKDPWVFDEPDIENRLDDSVKITYDENESYYSCGFQDNRYCELQENKYGAEYIDEYDAQVNSGSWAECNRGSNTSINNRYDSISRDEYDVECPPSDGPGPGKLEQQLDKIYNLMCEIRAERHSPERPTVERYSPERYNPERSTFGATEVMDESKYISPPEEELMSSELEWYEDGKLKSHHYFLKKNMREVHIEWYPNGKLYHKSFYNSDPGAAQI